jgi:hypothetical protein
VNRILAGVTAVTLIGLAVRAIPIAAADFPVNDGGLFFAMTRAIQAGWQLPVSVDWNGGGLPFTYPPLGLYLAGLTDFGLGMDLVGVFRFLPLAASSLVVPAVYLVGRSLLRSEPAGLAAALAYALTPTAFIWLVQGGGVTRAPGMLLGVLTIWQSVELVRAPGPGRAATTGVLAGLTVLTHPGAALFTALSAAVIWAFEGRSRRSFAWSGAAVGVAVLVAAPWAALVIQHHGLGGLLDVQNNGPDPRSTLIALLVGRLTGTSFPDPLALFGLGMAILCLVRRRFLLPTWFLASAFLAWQYAMVPFALLVAVAAIDVLAEWRARPARWATRVFAAAFGTLFAVEAAAASLAVLNPNAPLHALSPARRDAMAWVEANLPDDARVAVVTGASWAADPDSEWFPALTGRVSVGTVQGSEWLGRDAFRERLDANGQLQGCVSAGGADCVEGWLELWPADYVYLPRGHLRGPNSPDDCCADLRDALLAAPAFTRMYDGPGATIFQTTGLPFASQE